MVSTFDVSAAADIYRRIGERPHETLSDQPSSGGPLRVATDGSTLSHATSTGPSGWAYYVNDSVWQTGTLTSATSQCAELTAAAQAIADAPASRHLVLITDSQFIADLLFACQYSRRPRHAPRIRASTDWGAVALALWELVSARSAPVTVDEVRSHRGQLTSPENQAADHLARRARWAAMAAAGFPPSRSQLLTLNLIETRAAQARAVST